MFSTAVLSCSQQLCLELFSTSVSWVVLNSCVLSCSQQLCLELFSTAVSRDVLNSCLELFSTAVSRVVFNSCVSSCSQQLCLLALSVWLCSLQLLKQEKIATVVTILTFYRFDGDVLVGHTYPLTHPFPQSLINRKEWLWTLNETFLSITLVNKESCQQCVFSWHVICSRVVVLFDMTWIDFWHRIVGDSCITSAACRIWTFTEPAALFHHISFEGATVSHMSGVKMAVITHGMW